ncbi:MAG: DUF1059 domain-containing protein [Bacteroidota bacterium]
MFQKVVVAILVVLLSVAFVAPTFAQEAKKETKMEPKKEQKAAPLKSVSCDPSCGFMVRSHDEKELTSIVKVHAKKAHKMDMTDKQIHDMMKTEKVD